MAFRTLAPNLNAADDGVQPDVMVRDIASNRTIICSVHTSGAQAGSTCHHCHISQDGRFIVFESASTNLVNGDGNNQTDCFMHDRITGQTVRVSVGTFGTEANGASTRPRITRDGRFVSFVTTATNLADDDTNGTDDIYRRGPLR
jgi:Tol biopolymer transport system component